MKIFVSGQISDLKYVRNVQRALRGNGHVITHDWTLSAGDKILGSDEVKLVNVDECGMRARQDIQGVLDCDAYVICTDNIDAGKGMYAELGAALALNELNGLPKIYLLGSMKNMSIFYYHPSVKKIGSVDELIDELK